MAEIIKLVTITFFPFLELRASIPYGIFTTDFHWSVIFIICVVTNIILGFFIFLFLDWIMRLLTMIKPVEKLWKKYVEKTQNKINRGVEKYGEWAIVIFIGIPLPGSGVYSGALASYLIGLSFKKFVVANILGVLIAGVLVTVACISGSTIFDIFLKRM